MTCEIASLGFVNKNKEWIFFLFDNRQDILFAVQCVTISSTISFNDFFSPSRIPWSFFLCDCWSQKCLILFKTMCKFGSDCKHRILMLNSIQWRDILYIITFSESCNVQHMWTEQGFAWMCVVMSHDTSCPEPQKICIKKKSQTTLNIVKFAWFLWLRNSRGTDFLFFFSRQDVLIFFVGHQILHA